MSKNYIVIGASSGIGFNIAKTLLEEGNNIISLSRTKPDLPGITHHSFDASTDELDAIDIPEEVHGLVYAPGTINLRPFRGLKLSDFQNDFEVNLLGAVKALHWAQKPLSKTQGASVVLFSTVAVQQGMPFHASVAAAKGAVEGLTRSLAAEWAPKVRVNCVAPSLTDTPLAERLLNNETKRESAEKRHPLHRFGTSIDIANAVLFLLGDKSSWVTGQILGVDGGLSSLKVG